MGGEGGNRGATVERVTKWLQQCLLSIIHTKKKGKRKEKEKDILKKDWTVRW